MPLPELTLTFDLLLASLFPLAILLVGYKLFPFVTWKELYDLSKIIRSARTTDRPFSLTKAYQSYAQYNQLTAAELSRMRASYATLGRAHKRLGFEIGYPLKLDRLGDVTDLNATVTTGIAGLAREEFDLLGNVNVGVGDLGRVRESLKHFVRDWSEEGAIERERIFSPILGVLKQVYLGERQDKRVLVPGSGLGRLAWDISQLGFDTTANELSFFMNLAFRFLLSPRTTTSENEHTLRPYAHWFSHQRSNDSLFRAISFPDVVPRLNPNFHLAEIDFLSLSIPTTVNLNSRFWSKSELDDVQYRAGYDFIVTLFFLDTSLNVFATMEQIYKLLRPGGTWINLGPMFWTSGGQAKLELSLDEVLKAAEGIGFILGDTKENNDVTARRTIECEYTGDLKAMMSWIYKAEFWVAKKSK